MPAPNYSEPLDYQDSPLNSPLAIYDVDFAIGLVWRWQNLSGNYRDQDIRAKYMRVDNLDSSQFLNIYFDNVRFPVNAFQLLTLEIPNGAATARIEGDPTSLLTCEITFGIDVRLNQADTINFKAIQASGTEGILFPVIFKSGPYDPIDIDDGKTLLFTITGATGSLLPDPQTVSNGYNVQLWNADNSTANLSVTTDGAGPPTIEGAATPFIIHPGERPWLVADGANWHIQNSRRLNDDYVIYTANDTFDKADYPGLDYVVVELCGGGGAGGGATTTAAGQTSAGTGGSAAGYSRKKIAAEDLNIAGETITIGAGGTGAAGAVGGNGGTTSFGAHCSATGGNGAGVGAATASNVFAAIFGAVGNGVGGDVNIAGDRGTYGFCASPASAAIGGAGGSSILAAQTAGRNGSGNGFTGENYGGGGSGAANTPSQGTAQSGGNGAPGVCIVRLFFKHN